MRNPSPKTVFRADVGFKKNAKYCCGGDGIVIEFETFSGSGLSVLRIWEPVVQGSTTKFNAYLVEDWRVRCENWYSSSEDSLGEFNSLCSSDDEVEKFLENECLG